MQAKVKRYCLNCGKSPIVKPKFCCKKCYGEHKSKNSQIISKDKLVQLYCIDKLELSKIAEICKISVSTICKYVKKYQIQPRGNHIDYTNCRIGALLVIEPIIPKKSGKHVKWKCLCDCGNICYVISTGLDPHKNRGCSACQSKKTRSKDELKQCVWGQIKCSAKRTTYRTLEFTVNKEEAYNLFLKQNRRCALSGVEIRFKQVSGGKNKEVSTASLDRIDSSKGYTIDNVQWLHKTVNIMKQSLSQAEFIEWCRKIQNNHTIDIDYSI